MPHKGRFPVEEKVKIVEGYIGGEIPRHTILNQHGVNWGTLREWVRLYKTRGIEGLTPAKKNRTYSADVKRLAVLEYLECGSQHTVCKKYDISRRSMLQNWIKQYNGHGDFKQPSSGGAIYMTKGRRTTLEERIEIVSHCIAHNKDYGKTIERYNVSYQQIRGWIRKYEQDGPEALVDRRGKRKEVTAMTEIEKLQAQLKLKEAENLRLQMENELLKKLEALERGRSID